jgi:hypothetical protein
MGFAHPGAHSDIGELSWFDDLGEALRHSSFSGSGVRQMDGTEFARTAVITGLDKLSRLQQRPLSHFYSALAEDLMCADAIFVIGSGLADLHLNTWLKEARSRNPKPPILFIDCWKGGFLRTVFDLGREEIEMFHALGFMSVIRTTRQTWGTVGSSPMTVQQRYGRRDFKHFLMPRMGSGRF